MPINVKSYPFTLFLVAIVWILSLMPIPETPLNDVSMIDKWTHLVMYGGTFGVMWIEWWRRNRHSSKHLLSSLLSCRSLLLGWLLPVLMGGLLELLQAYCTNGRRSGDWLDFLANAIGVSLALLFGLVFVYIRRR